MANWEFVAHTEDLSGAGPYHVFAAGTDAVLVNIDGEFRAFEGLCPHQGALLGEGEIVDGQLVCRNHRWCFDTDTGERDGGPQCLKRFPLRIEEGRIELDFGISERTEEVADVIRFEDLSGPSMWTVMKTGLTPGGIERVHLWWEELTAEYGKTYGYEVRGFRIIASSETEMIADALRQRPDKIRRVDTMREVFEDLNAMNVFAEEGEAWRPLRRLVMKALAGRAVREFFPTMRRVTETLKERWEEAADEGRVLDIREELFRFTVDITTTLTFGHDPNLVGGADSWLLDRLEKLFPLIGKRTVEVIPVWKAYKTRKDRKTEAGAEEVREWVKELIEETRARHAELGDDFEPENFLETMVVSRDADGNLFDDDTIYGNALIMLLAGEDTTANTLTWAIHLLLDHPDELTALRAHLQEVIGESAVPETYEMASQLDAVENVANEALRLHGPAPNLGLAANEDVMVGNLALKSGDFFVALTRLASIDPDNIEDAATFRPSRWDDPKAASVLQRSGTFVPFGSGPRICPGRSLALLEMRMLLAMLYQNFEVERVGRSEDVEEVFGFTTLPRGVRVKLHRR